MIFSWNRIFTAVVGGTGVFSTGTYFFTRGGLEPSTLAKVYTGEDNEDKWSILMEKLKNKDDKDLHNIFLKVKNGSGNSSLAQECKSSKKWKTSSLFHLNKNLEDNVKEFCILRMIDIAKNDVIAIAENNGGKKDEVHKTEWETNAKNLKNKANEEKVQKKSREESTLTSFFLLLGNKLTFNSSAKLDEEMQKTCSLTYNDFYLPSKKLKLQNIRNYCNKNPVEVKKKK